MSIKFSDFVIPQDKLAEFRRELYHSQCSGYCVFPGFLPPEFVQHIRTFWAEALDPNQAHEPFVSKDRIRMGCPNFVKHSGPTKSNRAFFNFHWNSCPDQVSQTVAHTVQLLRNQVEGRPLFHEFFPHDGRSCSFRVVISREGDPVRSHRDWAQDPARLQATLFLSEHGVDYGGDGFTFEDNQGKELVFGRDVKLQPGDLALWRYPNRHSVRRIETEIGQMGFVRIIFPPEVVFPDVPSEEVPATSSAVIKRPNRRVVNRLRRFVRRIPLVGGALAGMRRTLKGLL